MPRQHLFAACIPTRATKVPSHPDWVHEVKHDRFRLIVSRDGDRVRLYSRNGNNFTDRYPLIVETALRIRSQQFVLDGEAVLLGVDGISDFDGLMSRQHEVQLYAFDVLALDGDDLRKLPLHLRKTNLARLLARRADGINLATGEIGPDPIPRRLQHEAGRSRVEAARQPLSSRHAERLDQEQEPGTPGNVAVKEKAW